MNKQSVVIQLLTYLALLVMPLAALGTASVGPIQSSSGAPDAATPNGDYVVYVLKDDVWKEAGKLSFDKDFRQKDLAGC